MGFWCCPCESTLADGGIAGSGAGSGITSTGGNTAASGAGGDNATEGEAAASSSGSTFGSGLHNGRTLTKVFQPVQIAKLSQELLRREKRPWIPEEDKQELLDMVTEVESWANEMEAEQATKQICETPAFQSEVSMDKLKPIAKLSQELLRREKSPLDLYQ